MFKRFVDNKLRGGGMRSIRLRGSASALAFLSCLLLLNCATVRYDDQLDAQLTTTESDYHSLTSGLLSAAIEVDMLKARTDTLYVAELDAAKKKLTYAGNIAAYDKVRVDLLNLRVRVDSDTGPTHSQLDSALTQIEENIFGAGSMRETHMKQDALSAIYISSDEKIVDAQFAALGTYVAVTKEGSTTQSSRNK